MDKLIEKIKKLNNPTVAGLDPKLEYIPGFIRESAVKQFGNTFEGAAAAILEFNKGLIDALCGVVPALKPQSAYYEMYGWQGVRTLHETIRYAREKGMYVIADVKRNDIGSTASAYAAAYLGNTELEGGTASEAFGADSVTVNPYLGTDGIEPFLDECNKNEKSIFVLIKTSNPSSGEFQDRLSAENKPMYIHVAELVKKWGGSCNDGKGYSNVGAVVGATYSEQAKVLREMLPKTFFLVPGYGAQGGTAKDVAVCFDKSGSGAIINSSRAIMCAYKKGGYDERDFAKAAFDEAARMKKEIELALS